MSTGIKLLLHVCCAPDGTVPLERLIGEGYCPTIFFYGSNIHPRGEYEKRKDAFLKLAELYGVPFITGSYEPYLWREKVRGHALEPEGGARCTECFRVQLFDAARTGSLQSCSFLATTLTISPHKSPELLNKTGNVAAKAYGMEWIGRIWRKGGGFQESVKKSREMDLYRQNYCGCLYSVQRR